MFKRFLSGLFVVVGVVLAYGMLNPKGSRAVFHAVYEFGTDLKATFRDNARETEKEKFAAEETMLNSQVAELKSKVAKLEAEGETSKAALYMTQLKTVEAKLAEVRKCQRMHILTMTKEQFEYERLKNAKRTALVLHTELKELDKLLSLEADMTQLQMQDLNAKLAEIVNAFMNAVEDGTTREVCEFCSQELQPAVNKEKVKAMRRAMPEGAFKLRHTVAGRECQVMFDGKHFLTLSCRDGEWFVSKVW